MMDSLRALCTIPRREDFEEDYALDAKYITSSHLSETVVGVIGKFQRGDL